MCWYLLLSHEHSPAALAVNHQLFKHSQQPPGPLASRLVSYMFSESTSNISMSQRNQWFPPKNHNTLGCSLGCKLSSISISLWKIFQASACSTGLKLHHESPVRTPLGQSSLDPACAIWFPKSKFVKVLSCHGFRWSAIITVVVLAPVGCEHHTVGGSPVWAQRSSSSKLETNNSGIYSSTFINQ